MSHGIRQNDPQIASPRSGAQERPSAQHPSRHISPGPGGSSHTKDGGGSNLTRRVEPKPSSRMSRNEPPTSPPAPITAVRRSVRRGPRQSTPCSIHFHAATYHSNRSSDGGVTSIGPARSHAPSSWTSTVTKIGVPVRASQPS